jgi:4-amino-4-deoxy-L-arabinose transferase-like glycosyltransferase
MTRGPTGGDVLRPEADRAARQSARGLAGGWVVPALLAVAAITLVRLTFVGFAGLDLDFEEAQYWFWSKDLAWGYFSKPPLIAWLIAGATSICGDGEACIRFPSPLLHAATAMIVGATGASLGTPENRDRLALWSAAGYATLPGISFSAFLMTTDVPLLFCWALALLAWLTLMRGGRAWWGVIGGLSLGFGLLAKYAMAYFLLGAVLHLLLSPAARRTVAARAPAFLVFLGLGLLIVAPNLAWNATDGFITFQHTAENVNLGEDWLHPGRALEFLGAQLGVFGPVLFVALITGIAFRRRRADDGADARLALGAFCHPVIALLLIQALLSRANANWAATAYVAGTVYVTQWLLERGRVRLLEVSLGLHVAAALGLYVALATVPAVAVPGLGAKPVAARLHGWDELGARVAAHLAAAPGSVLVSEYRQLLAILIYYAHVPTDLLDGAFAKWNSDHDLEDHFELIGATIDEVAPRTGATRFVIASERPEPMGILDRFDQWHLLEVVEQPLGAGLVRRHWIYEARGFKGY